MAYVSPSITASGITFAGLQAGGLSGHLEKLIAAQAATVAPTVAATWSATGGSTTGGYLAAGTYYQVITESNGIGETTAGPVSTQITVATANIPLITFQTLKSGNTARNVYLGLPSGATTGPFYLYATGITASTFACSSTAPSNSYAVTTPTVNSTGLTYTDSNGNVKNKSLEFLRSGEHRRSQAVYNHLRTFVEEFISGKPVNWMSFRNNLKHAQTFYAAMNTLCSELGTLIDSNPGSLTTAATGIGNTAGKRTWP